MKDQLDQRVRQLVTEVSDAAPPPPPLENLRTHPPAAALGSRRLMLAATMVVILGLVALGAVVVLGGDTDDSPSALVAESSIPSTAPTASAGAPTSAAEGQVGFEIETDADGVAITEVEIDGQRCLRLDGVEAPATASPILTCDTDVQPAGGPPARPGRLVAQRAEGTGRLVFGGLHDPSVATIVLRIDEESLQPYAASALPELLELEPEDIHMGKVLKASAQDQRLDGVVSGFADAVISTLEPCRTPDNSSPHADVTIGEHLAQKLAGPRGQELNDDATSEAACIAPRRPA